MLRKHRRLRSADVKELLVRGKRVSAGKAVSLRYIASPEPLRSGVVVRKALARSAVMRNKVRRAMYRALKEVPLPAGRALFFVERIPEGPLTPSLRSDLVVLLERI